MCPPTQAVRLGADGLQGAAAALAGSYTDHLKALVPGLVAGGGMPDMADPLSFLLSFGDLADTLAAAQCFTSELPEVAAAVGRLQALKPQLEQAARDLANGGARCSLDPSLLGPLADPAAAFRSCLAALQGVRLGADTFGAGAANYSRWVDVAADLPCWANDTRTFEMMGLRATSLPFPKFYKCTYATKLLLPPEFIPYVRLRGLGFVDGCAAAARAAVAPAPAGRPPRGGAAAGGEASPEGAGPAARRRRRPAPLVAPAAAPGAAPAAAGSAKP
jgi:hypothetical protein